MQVFLGDRVTIAKEDTWVTGTITGIVLDKVKQLERVYIEGLSAPFWLSDNWKFIDETEWDEEEENG